MVVETILHYIDGILATILAIISFIYKINGNKRSLENIKRFEIYEKIIKNENKILSYTYLRDYLGCPISDKQIEYILKSTRFYDFVTVYKKIYPYIDFDPETKEIIKYKNEQKLKRKLIFFKILYFIFLLPLLLVLIDPCAILTSSEYFIPLLVISIPFAIVAIFFFLFEGGNIAQVMGFMEKNKKEGA